MAIDPGLVAAFSVAVVGAGIGIGRRWMSAEARDALERAVRLSEESSGIILALSQKARDEERKRIEVVEVIGQANKERDEWRELYWQAGIGHSAAQDQMVAEIRRLSRILKAKGVDFRDKSEHFAEIAHGFRGKHGSADGPKEGQLQPAYQSIANQSIGSGSG